MKLGFICPKAAGHINPITALARQLQSRNHDVVFLYSSGAAGLPFVPGPTEDRIDQTIAEVSKLQGEEAFKAGISWIMSQTETILESLPAIVQANGIDALVIDTVHFYAELGAMWLGMPYIHVSAAMHHDYTGGTPLCHYSRPHQTTSAALARNR
jgi:zeaxanthin glucosyltransferase